MGLINVGSISLDEENMNKSDYDWLMSLEVPEDLDLYVEIEEGDESAVYKINQDLIDFEQVLEDWTTCYVHTNNPEHAKQLAFSKHWEQTKSFWSDEFSFAPLC